MVGLKQGLKSRHRKTLEEGRLTWKGSNAVTTSSQQEKPMTTQSSRGYYYYHSCMVHPSTYRKPFPQKSWKLSHHYVVTNVLACGLLLDDTRFFPKFCRVYFSDIFFIYLLLFSDISFSSTSGWTEQTSFNKNPWKGKNEQDLQGQQHCVCVRVSVCVCVCVGFAAS